MSVNPACLKGGAGAFRGRLPPLHGEGYNKSAAPEVPVAVWTGEPVCQARHGVRIPPEITLRGEIDGKTARWLHAAFDRDAPSKQWAGLSGVVPARSKSAISPQTPSPWPNVDLHSHWFRSRVPSMVPLPVQDLRQPFPSVTSGQCVPNCRLVIKVPDTRENGTRMRHSLPEQAPSVEGCFISVTESVPARVGPLFLELPFL